MGAIAAGLGFGVSAIYTSFKGPQLSAAEVCGHPVSYSQSNPYYSLVLQQESATPGPSGIKTLETGLADSYEFAEIGALVKAEIANPTGTVCIRHLSNGQIRTIRFGNITPKVYESQY